MEKITIVIPSTLTVPAIKGGAVEVLLENFLNENERNPKFYCTVIAHYIKGIEVYEKQYKYCRFIYIKMPTILIRINSILVNRFKQSWLPNIWVNRLVKSIRSTGNDKILIEGGVRIIYKIKEACPDAKIFYHLHADVKLHKSNQELKVINSLAGVICISNYLRKRQITYGVKRECLKVVLNGIDIKKFNGKSTDFLNEDIKRVFHIPKEGKIILFKGRIVKQKGIIELINAFSRMERKNAYLVLAGAKNFGEKRYVKSKYEKEVLGYVKKDERILFTGHIEYNKIPLLHQIADIAVVPSIWQEPCGLVVIEAIAAGNPLIVSKTGGIPEVINGTKAICIDVDENYIDNLCKAMMTLLDDESLCSQIRDSELQRMEYFSNERYVKELCAVLEL